MLLAKIEKKRLSGHGIEISFFPIDLKFKGNFLCTSVIMICLNSAIVLTGNSSSSRWLYFCTVYLCRAKPFEFLNSLPQVKQVEQVEQAEQRESLDRGVIGGVSIADGIIAVFTRFTTFQRAEKRVKIQKNIILT